MEATVYTPAQKQLLRVMSYVKTDKAMNDLNAVICEYFAKQIDSEMDRLWDEGVIDAETLKQWSNEHMRTAYK